MKGIILAGGRGTRLHPITLATSKQLVPVYDKPMIYYPLSTLILAGISEILIITNPSDTEQFRRLLGTGEDLGISISYIEQTEPRGIADAFLLAENFLEEESVCLILGDNIFHGAGLGTALSNVTVASGAHIFAHQVANPSLYGVVTFDDKGRVTSIEEKPAEPRSNFAIPGIYFFDTQVVGLAKLLHPSSRGELEISDLNNLYLQRGELKVSKLERGTVWLDTGNFDSLMEASEFVKVIEKRQGVKVGSPEEASWRVGFINDNQMLHLASRLEKSGYGEYLKSLVLSKY